MEDEESIAELRYHCIFWKFIAHTGILFVTVRNNPLVLLLYMRNTSKMTPTGSEKLQ